MEMLGDLAIEPSADLLQPCSLLPLLASASLRRMPVPAAARSRNSSWRCASPRETRTPGRWRRNRLVHSSMSNRRRPRSDAPRNRRKRRSRRPWRAPSVSINKEIELGVRGRWPPLSECTICSDPASRSSSCREVGCAALQTILTPCPWSDLQPREMKHRSVALPERDCDVSARLF